MIQSRINIEDLILAFSKSYDFEQLSFEQRKSLIEIKERELDKLKEAHNKVKNAENAQKAGRPEVWPKKILVDIYVEALKIMKEPNFTAKRIGGEEIEALRERLRRMCADADYKPKKGEIQKVAKQFQKLIRERGIKADLEEPLSHFLFKEKE